MVNTLPVEGDRLQIYSIAGPVLLRPVVSYCYCASNLKSLDYSEYMYLLAFFFSFFFFICRLLYKLLELHRTIFLHAGAQWTVCSTFKHSTLCSRGSHTEKWSLCKTVPLKICMWWIILHGNCSIQLRRTMESLGSNISSWKDNLSFNIHSGFSLESYSGCRASVPISFVDHQKTCFLLHSVSGDSWIFL